VPSFDDANLYSEFNLLAKLFHGRSVKDTKFLHPANRGKPAPNPREAEHRVRLLSNWKLIFSTGDQDDRQSPVSEQPCPDWQDAHTACPEPNGMNLWTDALTITPSTAAASTKTTAATAVKTKKKSQIRRPGSQF